MTDTKLCHMCWEKDKPGTVYVHNRGEFDRIQCCGDCLAAAGKPWPITCAVDATMPSWLLVFIPQYGMCFSCGRWTIAHYLLKLKMMRGSIEGGYQGDWPICRQCYGRAVKLHKCQLVNDLL